MHLEPLYISVLPRLAHTGSAEHAEGHYDLASIDIGNRHFGLSEGIAYEVDLVNTGEAVLLSGKASAELDTICDRCLKPSKLALSGEVQGYFLFDKESVEETEGLEVYEEVDRDGCVDIAPPLLAAIVVELPTVTVCGTDCSGPAIPLAEEPDDEPTAHQSDAINPESPFAALKDFKFDDK